MLRKRKLFYNKRLKLSDITELFFILAILFILAFIIIFWKGQYKINKNQTHEVFEITNFRSEKTISILDLTKNKFPNWFQNNELYADIPDYINKNLSIPNFTHTLKKYKNCTNLLLIKEGKEPNFLVMYFPWRNKQSFQSIYTGLTLAENLQNHKLKNSIAIILYDAQSENNCINNLFNELHNNIFINTAAVINFIPSDKKELEITGINGKSSSINWLNIFSDFNIPSLKSQISLAAYPFLTNIQSFFIEKNIPAISLISTVKVSEKKYFLKNSYTQELYEAVLNFDKNQNMNMNNNGFWLNKNNSTKYWPILIFHILGLLVIIILYLERFNNKNERFFPFQGFLSAVYFSLIAFILIYALKIYLLFCVNSLFNLIFLISITSIMIFSIIKFEEKAFIIKNNSISSHSIYMGVLIGISYSNVILFLILVPSAFLLKSVKYEKGIKYFLLTFFSLLIPLYFIFVNSSYSLSEVLSASFIINRIFTDFLNTAYFSFYAGSLMSLIKHEKRAEY
ncbi:MAG: hypothetical protein OEZ22_04375 [Spirochaetia bacterium]|nr:hypothetical protein [Spirochaetia bacterium]